MRILRYEFQILKKKIWHNLFSFDADIAFVNELSKALKKKYRIYDIIDCELVDKK